LVEIFTTEKDEDSWFGKQNVLFLGDLLQLPPVFEQPVCTNVSDDVTRKLTGSLSGGNLWRELFTYDELTINVRQKDEQEFVSLLSRVHLGQINNDDVKTLKEHMLPLRSTTVPGRKKEIVEALNALPPNTACLLPTRHMCMRF